MSVIPFPQQSRPLHPAFGGSGRDRSKARFVEDASAYGITTVPDPESDAHRSVAKQHLFRLGFGECPSIRRSDPSSPIVARNGLSIIGIVVSGGVFSASDIARARREAEGEAEANDEVSAAVMTVRFLPGERLRVEIVVAGSEVLQSIPPVPFD